MIKYICIKEIPDYKLIEFSRNKLIKYKNIELNKCYYIDFKTQIFDMNNKLTDDYHYFIFDYDSRIYFRCTIPENELNEYLISISEHRNNQIDEILNN